MAEFTVPVLPLRKPVIGPKLPPSDTDCDIIPSNDSTDKEEKHTVNDQEERDVPNHPNIAQGESQDKSTIQAPQPPPDVKLAYSEPVWGGEPPPGMYQLLLIKNGVEIGTVNLSDKSYCLCGRLPSCDIHLEHPSISRHHAILQYRPQNDDTTTSTDQTNVLFSNTPREAGFYLYDLGSTHGTYLTKNRLQPRCYYRMRVGQSVKFGGSTRLFVLDQMSESGGSQEIIEAEAVEEIAEITRKKEEYNELVLKAEEEERNRIKEQEEMGATWGMVMDDMPDEEKEPEDIQIDPQREAYYLSDPKKALKTFFDREGYDLEYENEETGPNHSKTYTIKVWLPIYTSTGESVYATGSVKGNKKAAVAECALEACRLLDADGILRESNHSKKKKLKTLEDNDYYDSDEDNFLDRTGDVERKRKHRMIRAGKINETVETYQSLADKLSSVQKELMELKNQLTRHKDSITGSSKGDSLDSYMKTVSGQLDSSTVTQIKLKIQRLQKEEAKLTKLVKVAAPYNLPGPGPSTTLLKSPDPVQSTSPHSRTPDLTSSSFKAEQEQSQNDDTEDNGNISVEKKDQIDSVEIESHEMKRAPPQYGLILAGDLRKDDGDNDPPPQQPTKKRRRQRMMGPTIPAELKKEIEKEAKWSSDFDPEFASWIPPENQTGDGKTSLNEKLGY